MGVEEEERDREKEKGLYYLWKEASSLELKRKIPSVCDSILKKKKCKSDGS